MPDRQPEVLTETGAVTEQRTDNAAGVRLAVLNARLEGIARKMSNTLLRTGRSGILTIARDFSCVILTADHRLLTVAESLPIHVLYGPDIMARTMTDNHPVLRRGDAYLHNSPYHGCTHPADHSILIPVIDDDDVHRFTVLAKAHQADCGNALPTTYMGAATDVYAEGALIFPAVKIQAGYQHNMDIVRMCQQRIRVPHQWWGDYLATLGAARIGEREMLALGREVGWDALEDFAEAWFDYSEQRMVQAISQVPSGRVVKTSTHDAFPGSPQDGITITVDVTVDAEAGRITVDMTDNPDCMPNGLNLSEGCALSAPLVGIFNSIDHTVPKNAGSFRRVDVKLRENCIVGVPRHPTSCSVATTNVADHVANPVQRAIADLADGLGMAETGSCIPPSCGVISGRDPRTGHDYVNEIYVGVTGGAAAPTTDGWLSIVHVGNAGMCYQDSIELDELRHPVFVEARRLLPNTEGPGRTRGALSAYSVFGPTDGAMTVAYVSDGNVNPAQGARGGLPGGCSSQHVRRCDGAVDPQPGCAEVRLEPGEMMVSVSCGGGGYESPLARDPERVRHDVAEGWISADRARAIYGVAFTSDGAVDHTATAALRDSQAGS